MLFNRKSSDPPPKGRRTLWLVAGVYLLYLVYQLLTDPNFKATAGFQKVAMIAGVILFIAFGILFIVSAVRGAIQEYEMNNSPAEPGDEDEQTTGEIPETTGTDEETETDNNTDNQ